MWGCEKMNEQYLTDEEYRIYFPKLSGLRNRIARDLPIEPGMRVLDLATGYGYFAIEVARLDSSLKIVGIDISASDISNSRENIEKEKLSDRIKAIQMDSTSMKFAGEEFDVAVNFLGLEDIHMTRGKEGVQKTFLEVSRVLRPRRYFGFVVMPPDQAETEAQNTELAIFSHICGATWLNSEEYEHILQRSGFKLVSKKTYRAGKKLSPEQAKAEIRFACENVPTIYRIKTPTFKEVWARFGRNIEENGMGHYSKVTLMIGRKT
jgi:ubiquinone/menaquinone biosynthesis C-methylase UbiE